MMNDSERRLMGQGQIQAANQGLSSPQFQAKGLLINF